MVVGALDATLQILRCAGTAQQVDAQHGSVRLHHRRSGSGSSSGSEMLCWLLLACRSFGVPTVPVKLLVKDLPSLFESKDVKARDKVKEIVVR